MGDTTVGEIMTRNVTRIHINAIVSEAVKIFKEGGFHHLPVVEEDGKLVGIISLTDIDRLKSGASLFRNPRKEEYDSVIFEGMWVRDIMTKAVVELLPSDSIRLAYDIFKVNKFRALPIVSNGTLMGIVTPLDILKFFFQDNK